MDGFFHAVRYNYYKCRRTTRTAFQSKSLVMSHPCISYIKISSDLYYYYYCFVVVVRVVVVINNSSSSNNKIIIIIIKIISILFGLFSDKTPFTNSYRRSWLFYFYLHSIQPIFSR